MIVRPDFMKTVLVWVEVIGDAAIVVATVVVEVEVVVPVVPLPK